jgi:hypothetical protein
MIQEIAMGGCEGNTGIGEKSGEDIVDVPGRGRL